MISISGGAPSVRRTLVGLGRYTHLLRNLVLKDLKLKYRGSVIGFAWSLANPLLMATVYTVAFTKILRASSEGFVFYLMLGLLAWTYFSNSTAMSAGSIADNGGLVKSVWFPRAILPTATVLFNLAQYLLTVLVIVPAMLVYFEVPPAAPMLLFPVFVGLQTLFSIGLGMILATSAAFFRDVRHLVEVAIMVMFWTTPIVYQLDQLSDRLRPIILLSPMSPYIGAYQTIFYRGQWPDRTMWILAIAYASIAVCVGLWLIVRNEDRLAERI